MSREAQSYRGVYTPPTEQKDYLLQVHKLYPVEQNNIISFKIYLNKLCFSSSFRNMLPDIAIAVSASCGKFFHLEDFEFSYLSNASCPYSRVQNLVDYGNI